MDFFGGVKVQDVKLYTYLQVLEKQEREIFWLKS